MKSYIKSVVEETLLKAEKIYNRAFPMIPVNFNLKGTSAGRFCFRKNSLDGKELRFNLHIAEANGMEAYYDTIIHEAAHYIVNLMHKNYKPHGVEWKSVMLSLGFKPKTTHSYTIPSSARTMRRYTYTCSCRTHEVSAIIHNKIRRGESRICKKCKGPIEYSPK